MQNARRLLFVCLLVYLTALTQIHRLHSGRMVATDILGRIWKQAVMAYFKVLSQNLPGNTKRKGNFIFLDS